MNIFNILSLLINMKFLCTESSYFGCNLDNDLKQFLNDDEDGSKSNVQYYLNAQISSLYIYCYPNLLLS